MLKKLGISASLLLLSTTAILWSGCSDSKCCQEEPICEKGLPSLQSQPASHPTSSNQLDAPAPQMSSRNGQPTDSSAARQQCGPKPQSCAPACQPQPCAPAPACQPVNPCLQEPLCKKPVKCRHPSSNELNCADGITVVAKNPSMCMLGDQYPLEFTISACQDVCDAIVTTHLPEGVTYIKSSPEAKVEGNKLVWNIGHMTKGECIVAKVWLKCECEGELCACFCASATPVRFCSLLCAKPLLTCEKKGPTEVCPGDPIHYTVTVLNRGSCAAHEVVITDNLPAGVEHASGQRTLCYRLGTLEPCQSRTVDFCVTAVTRGKICNTAVVSACDADSTSCQWCTNICKECVELSKVGPKEQMIGKNADYQITVVNPGDKTLTDVIVTDQAPSATSIVSANGAKINGNQAMWRLKELKPGEKVNFNLTLTTCTPGCFTNKVHVTNCQNCEACAEFTTRWKGRPAINICLCNQDDPICVGDTTSYSFKVVNQGSEADNNVTVTVRLPDELVPLAALGASQGTISGQTITFAPLNNFGARQVAEFRVDARAKSAGDARVSVEVSSDSLKTPLTQQTSTVIN
ncbi:MAG: OmcB family cysteine-rich outer membrane protein [Parachlamydiaceae bacterium]